MHSNLLLRYFLKAGVEPGPFARRIRGATELAPAEIFGQDRLYWRDVAHPRSLEWPTFLVSALDMALSPAGEVWWTAQIDRLHIALTVDRGDGKRSLHPRFMLDTSLCKDHLGSFLAADWSMALRRLLAVEAPSVTAGLSRETLRADRLQALTTLEGDHSNGEAWVFLAGMCEDYGFDPELQPRLGDLLATLDLTALAAGPYGYRFSLAVMQNFVAVCQEQRIARRLEAQLPLLATALATAEREEGLRQQDRAKLLEAAYVLAAAEPTVPRAVEVFVRVLDRLCDVETAFVDLISPLVRRLWRWLSGDALVRLVPLFLRVRRDACWSARVPGVSELRATIDDDQEDDDYCGELEVEEGPALS